MVERLLERERLESSIIIIIYLHQIYITFRLSNKQIYKFNLLLVIDLRVLVGVLDLRIAGDCLLLERDCDCLAVLAFNNYQNLGFCVFVK